MIRSSAVLRNNLFLHTNPIFLANKENVLNYKFYRVQIILFLLSLGPVIRTGKWTVQCVAKQQQPVSYYEEIMMNERGRCS